MRSAEENMNVRPLVRASYVVLLSSLVAGMILTSFSLRAAMLAAAVIFGWSQIGGA